MQTFLPYESFVESAKCLDRMRLGKQRVECKQILLALRKGPVTVTEEGIKKTPWYNHPATRMWRGYESALALYGRLMCEEWINRGYNDSLRNFFDKRAGKSVESFPKWLGNDEFHNSHQSNLMRKNSQHYAQFGWSVPNHLPYMWPSNE